MSTLVITGHSDLSPDIVPLVADGIRAALAGYPAQELVGVTCLARGADQVFARIVLDIGGSVEVVLPAADYRDRKVKPDNTADFDDLIGKAAALHTMPFPASNREANMAAGEHVLGEVDAIVAVWDGGPSGGHGGTADVVAAAHARTGGDGRVAERGQPPLNHRPAGQKCACSRLYSARGQARRIVELSGQRNSDSLGEKAGRGRAALVHSTCCCPLSNRTKATVDGPVTSHRWPRPRDSAWPAQAASTVGAAPVTVIFRRHAVAPELISVLSVAIWIASQINTKTPVSRNPTTNRTRPGSLRKNRPTGAWPRGVPSPRRPGTSNRTFVRTDRPM
jgi:hypothetical protein